MKTNRKIITSVNSIEYKKAEFCSLYYKRFGFGKRTDFSVQKPLQKTHTQKFLEFQ